MNRELELEVIQPDVYKSKINKKVAELLKMIRRDPDYEMEFELMTDIVSIMLKWIPRLWRTGIEQRSDLSVVQDCLVFCTKTIKKVENCDSE
jgi:hypothetical protein